MKIGTAMGTVALTVMGLAGSRLGAQTQSIKEAERFIKTGGETAAAVADARLKTKNALDAYNVLVQGNSKDLKDDYKTLQKAEQDMNDHVADARKKIDEMDKQGAVYFTQRAAALATIQDAALRAQAKARLDASQKKYERVKAALRQSGEALKPFTKNLSDQISYLGGELTPAAAASLKPRATTLNKRGATVLARIENTVASANTYFNTLRAE